MSDDPILTAIGRRREVLEKGGRLVDVVFMDCLANDLERQP